MATNVNVPEKRPRRWPVLVVGLLGLCMLLGFIGMLAGPRGGNTGESATTGSQAVGNSTDTPAQVASKAEPPTEAPKSAPSDTPAPPPPTDTAKPAALTVGSTGTTGGLKVTLNGVRRSSKGYIAPKQGMEYVVVDVTIENAGDKEAAISSLLMEELRDGTGQRYRPGIGAEAKSSAEGKVASGDKVRGETSFEVPKDATGLVFIFDPVFGDSLRFTLDK